MRRLIGGLTICPSVCSVSSDLEMDRRRADGARFGRDHHAGGEQDGPLGQAAGLHRGRRAQGQGAQRHVHRDLGQGRVQRQTTIQGCMRLAANDSSVARQSCIV